MKFWVLVDIEEPDSLETPDDEENWMQDTIDGLGSVDLEGTIRETLDDWYGGVGEAITVDDVRPAERRFRVQVELHGKPAKFYVDAPDKAAAKAKVQDMLGPADFFFTRTYELPVWQR